MTNANTPLISVVIVTHNRAKLAARAIESVLAQPYSPIEIVLVDNCSTDTLPDWQVRDGQSVVVIRTPHFSNSSQSRNLGIDNAAGAYIGFLDDDDYYLPEKLAKQAAILTAQPEIDFTFTNTEAIGPDDQRMFVCGGVGDLHSLMRNRYMHLNSLLVRRGVLERERFNNRMSKYIDAHLVFRLAEKYRGHHLDEIGAVWIRDDRPDQITQGSMLSKVRKSKKLYDNWKILCEDFAEQIERHSDLRRMYYGKQAALSALNLKPLETLHYAIAAASLRSNQK